MRPQSHWPSPCRPAPPQAASSRAPLQQLPASHFTLEASLFLGRPGPVVHLVAQPCAATPVPANRPPARRAQDAELTRAARDVLSCFAILGTAQPELTILYASSGCRELCGGSSRAAVTGTGLAQVRASGGDGGCAWCGQEGGNRSSFLCRESS